MRGYLADRHGVVADHQRLVDLSKPICRHLGWLTVDEIKPTSSRLYANRRRGEGVKDGTIRRELGGLRAAMNWALEEEWIAKVPVLKMPPPPPSKDRWLTREEADRLIDACKSHHVKTFVQIALNTAARKGAILDLEWDQVDFERKRISLNPAGRAQTSKKRAIVPINAPLMAVLVEAYQLRQSEFVIEWNGERAGSIRKAFERAAERAGMPDVTPHVLRHTAATWMAMRGVDLRKIQIFLGHESLATTERIYAHHSPDYLQDAAEALT